MQQGAPLSDRTTRVHEPAFRSSTEDIRLGQSSNFKTPRSETRTGVQQPIASDPVPPAATVALDQPTDPAMSSSTLHADQPPTIPPEVRRGLMPAQALTKPSAPLEVTVQATDPRGALTLQIMDRDGHVTDTIAVSPGTVDLQPLSASLTGSQQTMWIQLVEDGNPIEAPIWITPLRSPPPVRTVRSIRASNQQPYTRIIGWGDRAFDPQDADTKTAMPQWTAPEPVITSGFRMEQAVDCILHTSEGSIRVAFVPDAAPETVENFLRLARSGFYDATIFHRIVPLDREGRPFVVQGGDPTGTGDGGPGWNLALEPSSVPHDRGIMGMARGDDPNSAGSQFYFSLSRQGTARLDGQYCTFAGVVDGWDAMDRLAKSEIADASSGRPRQPPLLQKVEVVPAQPRVANASVIGAAPSEEDVTEPLNPSSASAP